MILHKPETRSVQDFLIFFPFEKLDTIACYSQITVPCAIMALGFVNVYKDQIVLMIVSGVDFESCARVAFLIIPDRF